MFEWDEAKRAANIAKHGIDFIRAKEIWQGPVLEMPSPQSGHSENRFLAIGVTGGLHITVIYTWRGANRRIISAIKARGNERRYYEEGAW